ncbi:MAG: filamentous hemagglutinin N-terminal domain-containing protein [Scytonematopsis contorta HA4267-MV1]|jgi:filamentous hemagglutinin family protein|nr:filamentous hemagglutinin N-terminal domain-containing protein [Scytonematopsis contorta HA4267-MV1]
MAVKFSFLWVVINIIFGSLIFTKSATAEIIPDNTLPKNSQVTPGCTICNIQGGTAKGVNLFHSFQEFSIPTGGEAFFNNSIDIQNIFSRVTGNNVSNIDGLIRTSGKANLFFINPNGIIFGENARLDIGGSFIGTTANSIKFADGNYFSAKTPESSSLLTVSVPVGLQFAKNPGKIEAQGRGHSLTEAISIFVPNNKRTDGGLRVQAGKTLAFIGGEINLNGGVLTAERGQIELGSVGEGLVSLNSTVDIFTFDYKGISNFQDIQLSQQTILDASGNGAGWIQVQGRQVNFKDGSILFLQNRGRQSGGNVVINASDWLSFSGMIPSGKMGSGVQVENLRNAGSSANVTISTKNFNVENGSGITVRTLSNANSGQISVNATESLRLVGFLPKEPTTRSFITTFTASNGQGGDISIFTRQLSVIDGASIGTPAFGSGSGGSVTINAEKMEIVGASINSQSSSLSATTFGLANAGSIILNTDTLVLKDGGSLTTASLGQGNAGNLTVNASESLQISGFRPGTSIPSQISSSATTPTLNAILGFGLAQVPRGNSGNVTINSPVIKLSNGGMLNVRNEGIGHAGSLKVNAELMLLDDWGSITASSSSGGGGNIFLEADTLQLRRNSNITTNTGGGKGDGGNIFINSNTLVALENSDITANSINGSGGQITINTQALLGTQYRQQITPQSDVTATSGKGASFNGVVNINALTSETDVGVVELPDAVIDNSKQMATGCSASNSNRFIITGRGGLPLNPIDLFSGSQKLADLVGLVDLDPQVVNEGSVAVVENSQNITEVVEARGMIVDSQGRVSLVAESLETGEYSQGVAAANCQSIQGS